MKHTSICLAEEMHAKILRTGKPTNAVINEALEAYFSDVITNKDRVQEEIKKCLQADDMQAFFKEEVREAIMPYIGNLIPSR